MAEDAARAVSVESAAACPCCGDPTVTMASQSWVCEVCGAESCADASCTSYCAPGSHYCYEHAGLAFDRDCDPGDESGHA